MAINGLSLTETWDYYSRFDEAESDEFKTKWTLGSLDVNLRAVIGDNSMALQQGADGMVVQVLKTASRNLETVRYGLKSVERFANPAGGEFKVEHEERIIAGKSYRAVKDSFLNLIPPLIISELAEEILTKNTLSEAMRKKLVTP
jgi:hypothetical protein